MHLAPVIPASPSTLASHRVHEAEGAARRVFALFQSVRHSGPVVWIRQAHIATQPMPTGLSEGLSHRLLLILAGSETDLLWAIEECLRSKAVALVIAEPTKPLSLTAGRRLQLAAEAGQTTGLMLVQEGLGSNAAETRWSCMAAPSASPDSTLHRWSLNKNKKGTIGEWMIDWDGKTRAFHMVPPTGERCGAPGTAG